MSLYEVYATQADLAEYLGRTVETLPADSARLLKRASETVQGSIVKQYTYIVDSVEVAANKVEAKKLATCAQVEFWLEAGENTAVVGNVQSYRTGDISVNMSNISNGQLCKRARNYLNSMGLLYRGISHGVNYGSERV